jgi:hypothetical protein
MEAIMNLFIDIETLPDMRPGAREAFLQDARENFKAPSTLTKEQAATDLGLTDVSEIKFTSKDAMLARWCEWFREEKADEVGDLAWRKTSFDGGAGHVACIGFAVDDEPVQARFGDVREDECIERDTLGAFFNWLDRIHSIQDRPRFVGHNVSQFDLRFLWQRAIVLGIRPPIWLPRNPKPWDDAAVFDTMAQWAGSGNRISLDNLCKALGVSGKTGGIDGSLVWDYVRDGRIKEVAAYCKNDVEITRDCFRRMTFAEAA